GVVGSGLTTTRRPLSSTASWIGQGNAVAVAASDSGVPGALFTSVTPASQRDPSAVRPLNAQEADRERTCPAWHAPGTGPSPGRTAEVMRGTTNVTACPRTPI